MNSVNSLNSLNGVNSVNSVQAVYSAVLPPSLTVFFHFVTEKGKELKSHPVFGFVLGHSFNPGISAFPASNILDRAEVHTAQDSTCFCGENSNLCFIGFKEFCNQEETSTLSDVGVGELFLKYSFLSFVFRFVYLTTNKYPNVKQFSWAINTWLKSMLINFDIYLG